MNRRRHAERVAVLALAGVYPFELGIPSRIFGATDGLYEIATCSTDGQPVPTEADFSIGVAHGPELLSWADTVVIPSVAESAIPVSLPASVFEALARIRPDTRIISICTGAFVLAAAGFLDGRRATTHWHLADLFCERYPHIQLDRDVLYVADGRMLTSAGAASGVDVCLHVVRADHGSEVANAVARRCVVPPFREGGQAQFIERPIPEFGTASTADARLWAMENLRDPLPLSVLARQAGMSVRTFSRRFSDEVGMGPAQWVIQQRVTEAQRLLESTDLSIERIASEAGFANSASLRQHMQASIGVSPRVYRQTFGRSAPRAVTDRCLSR